MWKHLTPHALQYTDIPEGETKALDKKRSSETSTLKTNSKYKSESWLYHYVKLRLISLSHSLN